MSDILEKILATKALEVARDQESLPLAELKAKALAQPAPRDFTAAILAKHAAGQPAIIAEIKKASPSKGLIRADFDPVWIAQEYEAAGAACLSVLTDEQYFQGSFEYLQAARQACSLPVLRKDFIIDEYQIYQARYWGADAILLIAAALSTEQMQAFEATAHALNMSVLVEVHNMTELQKCTPLTTPLLGINNRDLRTFDVSLDNTLALLPHIQNRIVVTESGISSKSDVDLMRRHGVETFLIGETFMKSPYIREAVAQLL